jgi:hypothetical protein
MASPKTSGSDHGDVAVDVCSDEKGLSSVDQRHRIINPAKVESYQVHLRHRGRMRSANVPGETYCTFSTDTAVGEVPQWDCVKRREP